MPASGAACGSVPGFGLGADQPLGDALPRDVGAELDRLDLRLRRGAPLAGPAERGPVVGRGADDRQSDRRVDAALEAEHLDRDVALVVVLRDADVELALVSAREEGVAGPGAADVDPLGPRRLDRGRDLLDVLAAEQAVL